jgi:hypothetical protein
MTFSRSAEWRECNFPFSMHIIFFGRTHAPRAFLYFASESISASLAFAVFYSAAPCSRCNSLSLSVFSPPSLSVAIHLPFFDIRITSSLSSRSVPLAVLFRISLQIVTRGTLYASYGMHCTLASCFLSIVTLFSAKRIAMQRHILLSPF